MFNGIQKITPNTKLGPSAILIYTEIDATVGKPLAGHRFRYLLPYGRCIISGSGDAITLVLDSDTDVAVCKPLVVTVSGLSLTRSTARSPALSRTRLFARDYCSTARGVSMLNSGLLAQIQGRTQVGMQCAASKQSLSWDYLPGISHGNLSDTRT